MGTGQNGYTKTRKNKELKTKNQHDKKVVVVEKIEGKQGMKSFRSKLKQILDLMEDLEKEGLEITTKHEEELKKTEFWNFIRVLKEGKLSKMECGKTPKALEFIISSYVSTNAFKIGGRTLRTDANSVAVIFGMKRRKMGEEDKKKYGPKEDPSLFTSDLFKRYLKNDDPKNSRGKLMKCDIVKAIKNVLGQENKEKEFVQLLVLYVCCTTFFTNCGGMYINYKFLNCVKSIDAINRVSWPDLIHDHLMESIAALHKKPYSINGCTLYLLYWVFEHIKGIKRKDEKSLPRFATWNSYDASCDIESKWETFSEDQVSEDFVTSLTDEEKELCCFEKVANKEYENMEDSLASMTASNTLLQMMYKQRGTVIDAKVKIIDSLESEAEEKDKIIANLKSEVKERDIIISALKSAIKEKDKIIPAVSDEYQVPTELAANMVNTGETTPEVTNDSAEQMILDTPPGFSLNLTQKLNRDVLVDDVPENIILAEPMALVNPLGSIEGNVKFDQQYRRMKRKSLSPDFVEVGNNNKGGEEITEDMPAPKKQRSGNCERLDKNNTITASNVNRICVDDEAKIEKLKLEKRQQVENEMLRKELRDKDEALEQSRELNNVLILKEHQQNNELQQIRKILIHGIGESSSQRSVVRLREMGELDQKPFLEALKDKCNSSSEEQVLNLSTKLCSFWDQMLKDQTWHPFKVTLVEGKQQELVDDEDRMLKGLKNEWGEKVYDAVVNALVELNEYNPSGRNSVQELWNFKEERKATLIEGVSSLVRRLRKLPCNVKSTTATASTSLKK